MESPDDKPKLLAELAVLSQSPGAIEFARHRLRSKEDAEDAAQTATLECILNIDQYNAAKGALVGWFYTRLKWVCSGYYRRAARRNEISLDECLDAVPLTMSQSAECRAAVARNSQQDLEILELLMSLMRPFEQRTLKELLGRERIRSDCKLRLRERLREDFLAFNKVEYCYHSVARMKVVLSSTKAHRSLLMDWLCGKARSAPRLPPPLKRLAADAEWQTLRDALAYFQPDHRPKILRQISPLF